jgi:DNA-3-methyladenine glycosylase II
MRAEARNAGGMLVLRPALPLDVDRTLERHARWGVDPANVCAAGALFRVARVGGTAVPYPLEAQGVPRGRELRVTFAGPDTAATRAALRREVTHLCGLDFDLAGFYRQAARDPVLAPLAKRFRGLRPTVAPDPFEMLVSAIAAQQVNLAFAFTVRARIVRAFGEPCAFGGVTVYAFPTPDVLARVRAPVLRAMQLTTRKAEYVVGLAREMAEGRLDLPALAREPDQSVIEQLTRVRGLGRWTAEWFLARALGRPDVCPADDLGVRRAFEAFVFRGRAADPAGVRRYAERWRPHRSLAVHYLLAARHLAGASRARQAAAPLN